MFFHRRTYVQSSDHFPRTKTKKADGFNQRHIGPLWRKLCTVDAEFTDRLITTSCSFGGTEIHIFSRQISLICKVISRRAAYCFSFEFIPLSYIILHPRLPRVGLRKEGRPLVLKVIVFDIKYFWSDIMLCHSYVFHGRGPKKCQTLSDDRLTFTALLKNDSQS